MEFALNELWRKAWPEAVMGVLVIEGVSNAGPAADLAARRSELESELRRRYAGFDRARLKSTPELKAYDEFYHGFKKTYHLQLQLESILGGKAIPGANPLVSAMFMAELEDLLLTAGHDLRQVTGPVHFDASRGDERYERMNGEEQVLKANDLYSADSTGVLSSVIYGPDRRTRIQSTTEAALFTTYGVPGIGSDQVAVHLRRLRDLIQIFSPAAETLELEVISP